MKLLELQMLLFCSIVFIRNVVNGTIRHALLSGCNGIVLYSEKTEKYTKRVSDIRKPLSIMFEPYNYPSGHVRRKLEENSRSRKRKSGGSERRTEGGFMAGEGQMSPAPIRKI